jgi:signal transduction histidine kinase
VRRLRLVLFAAVCGTLVAFGVVADRALEGQARQARQAAREAGEETARLAAQSVAAALTPIEQSVLASQAPEGVLVERTFVEPTASVPEPSTVQYRQRRRAELVALLQSTQATSSGLPEAVVAHLALGHGPSSSESEIARRLLDGQLPVRREDLPVLADAIGVGSDPRVARLLDRLRDAPAAEELPAAPVFRRRYRETAIDGWTHAAGQRIHYAIPTAAVLSLAKVPADTVAVTTTEAARPHAAVPEVEGLSVHVPARAPAVLRIHALRLALWVAVGTSIIGLLGAHRALAAEARANAREKAFLTAVTHELRTPLAAIRLFGETLAEGRGNARDYGTLVAHESHRLEDLVERVLAATRAGESPRFAETAPGEVLRSALELITPKAERRAVTLTCRAEPALPTALWDADAVRRALLNLLDNAVKHGREGGHVEARAEANGDVVDLSVVDDGPGIGPRERKGLFERFARGTTDAPGTGLGLHLAEQVARAHGGRVDLVTAEGRGCTFTLRLPVRPPNAPPAAPTA